MVEIPKYAFENLWTDGELNLYRGCGTGELRPILVVAPVLRQPAREVIKRLEHQYSLLDGLDLDCALKTLALIRYEGRRMLVLEDPGPKVVELGLLVLVVGFDIAPANVPGEVLLNIFPGRHFDEHFC